MDDKIAQLILDELFASLETLETQTAAMLQFLKDKGASDGELALYLEQAGKASSIKRRAARVRIDHLVSAITSPPRKAAEQDAPKRDKKPQEPAEQKSKEKSQKKDEEDKGGEQKEKTEGKTEGKSNTEGKTEAEDKTEQKSKTEDQTEQKSKAEDKAERKPKAEGHIKEADAARKGENEEKRSTDPGKDAKGKEKQGI